MKWFVGEETVLFKRTGKENVINSTNTRWNFKKKNPTRSLQPDHFYNNAFVLLKVNKKGEKNDETTTHVAPCHGEPTLRRTVFRSAETSSTRRPVQSTGGCTNRDAVTRVYTYICIYIHKRVRGGSSERKRDSLIESSHWIAILAYTRGGYERTLA